MKEIPFSPKSSEGSYHFVKVDDSDLENSIGELRRIAHEQVLTRNIEFSRSVVFATSDLQAIMGDPRCSKIRLTHVLVEDRISKKKFSSLLAIGQTQNGTQLIDAPVFVGTPGDLNSQGVKINISKGMASFTNHDTTSFEWKNNLSATPQDLIIWLKTAFHDQKPVFLPLLARLENAPYWVPNTEFIAFAPAIFECDVKKNPPNSPSGWYCTYIIIPLDGNKKPVGSTKFFLVADMWRPNYPISMSYLDDTMGVIPIPDIQPGAEDDPEEYRDTK